MRASPGTAGLTAGQARALREIAVMRPCAGNDDGWVLLAGSVPRPTLAALLRHGLLEIDKPGFVGPTSGIYHRITPAGRAALSARPARDEGGKR